MRGLEPPRTDGKKGPATEGGPGGRRSLGEAGRDLSNHKPVQGDKKPAQSPPTMTAIPRCARCGSRHRTWERLASCLMRPLEWASGNGPWASVADCRGIRTVELYSSEAEAMAAFAAIDRTACGGRCIRNHYIRDLREIRGFGR